MSSALHPSPLGEVTELTYEFRLAALAPRPQDPEATGLDQRMLADLVAKHLHTSGTLTLAQLTERLGLSGPIVESVLGFLRREAKIEIKPRLEGGGLPYALTERGRASALDALLRSGYVGAAPVPLADYVDVVIAQTVHARRIDRDRVRKAFEGMHMPESVADKFGISINSGRPLFIYGPAGTGKSYVTQRLSRLFRDIVLIPRAIAIDETIVQVFDPLLHKAIGAGERQSIMLERGYDARYVACERPVVVTGGELTIDLLDIRYDPATRQYEAPLQLKANNGLFVIDDLGRQKVAPDALLNRWIVPMNERRDYHSLGSGRHFVAPFDLVLVFSSNMHPLDLTDEAFLRRIGHKIYCGYVSREGYMQIWENVCAERDVVFDRAIVHFVMDELHARREVPLLPCHPRDLIDIALDKAAYIGATNELTQELLVWAWDTYFVSMDDAAAKSMRSARGVKNG